RCSDLSELILLELGIRRRKPPIEEPARNLWSKMGIRSRTISRDGDDDRWYLGIWYKTISKRSYVSVANRDNPLSNSIGTLKVSNDANLILLDRSDTPVWSTNLTKAVKSPVVAELLANGNFVLRESTTKDPNRFLWQSFDFPVDTLLPEMKIGLDLKTGHDKFLKSWKSPNDPSSGDLSFKLETQGLPEFYLWKQDFKVYRTGPWNGIRFNGIPKMQDWSYVVNSFIENREEVTYTFKVANRSINTRFTLTSDGYCDMKTSPICNCIRGFEPRYPTSGASGETYDGCVRRSPLSCGGQGFLRLSRMKLPETSRVIVDKTIGLKECKERCDKDCNCTGFANTDIGNGGSGCVLWTGELVDMRTDVDSGQDFYVKSDATATIRCGSDINNMIHMYTITYHLHNLCELYI
ncbi:hypothetical protein EUTSA_v10002984mg, partial [Eutrema salsugineum]